MLTNTFLFLLQLFYFTGGSSIRRCTIRRPGPRSPPLFYVLGRHSVFQLELLLVRSHLRVLFARGISSATVNLRLLPTPHRLVHLCQDEIDHHRCCDDPPVHHQPSISLRLTELQLSSKKNLFKLTIPSQCCRLEILWSLSSGCK
jgi:hypothetical protein